MPRSTRKRSRRRTSRPSKKYTRRKPLKKYGSEPRAVGSAEIIEKPRAVGSAEIIEAWKRQSTFPPDLQPSRQMLGQWTEREIRIILNKTQDGKLPHAAKEKLLEELQGRRTMQALETKWGDILVKAKARAELTDPLVLLSSGSRPASGGVVVFNVASS